MRKGIVCKSGVFFVAEKEAKMGNSILCPRCHRKVGTYDGKSTIDKIITCRKCRKLVIYRVVTGETELKLIPPRACSSGMTF